MSVPHLLAAHTSVTAAGYQVGSGRLVPALAAVVGLISIVVGAWSRARSRRAGTGRTGTTVAVVLGLTGVVVGGVHMANSAGGLGTGNGLAGAIVAVVLGLIGMAIGGPALARSRRRARPQTTAPGFRAGPDERTGS